MTTMTTTKTTSLDEIGDAADLVADLCELEEGLTEWEVEFIDALARRDPFKLTQKELLKLMEIAAERL